MYSKIVNPKTGRKVNVNSVFGRKILRKYLSVLEGGSSLARREAELEKELESFFENLKSRTLPDATSEQVEAMAIMDKDGSGDVDYAEFRAWYLDQNLDRLAWEELSDVVKYCWGVLGWNEGSWAYQEPPPTTENMDWDELTEEQRVAAMSLGYREQSWSDPWSDLTDANRSCWETMGWTEESWKGTAPAPATGRPSPSPPSCRTGPAHSRRWNATARPGSP